MSTKTGVLLVNLGTPAAPTPQAVRAYLKEFLSDQRVVGLPRLIWWPILNGIILNTRPAKSAAKYAKVWMNEGSPLKVYTERQASLLAQYLPAQGHAEIEVSYAMRYGAPAVATQLDALVARGCERIVIVPLYPQYAESTTASVMDAVAAWQQRMSSPSLPKIEAISSYPTHPGYIAALAASIREYWAQHGRGEKLVMSFHGLPKKSIERGDPYYNECQATGLQVAQALGLSNEQYLITFQSRFGFTEWLQPYTQLTLENLATSGCKRVDVVCPGFVADCLETLEEIAMECKEAFLEKGGTSFHYIPCLNERSDWIAALAEIALADITFGKIKR